MLLKGLKGKEGQIPAEGSNEVLNHEIPNTTEGYDAQKQFLKSPLIQLLC
jgi:hypothetical protein